MLKILKEPELFRAIKVYARKRSNFLVIFMICVSISACGQSGIAKDSFLIDIGRGIDEYSLEECRKFPKDIFCFNRLSDTLLVYHSISPDTVSARDITIGGQHLTEITRRLDGVKDVFIVSCTADLMPSDVSDSALPASYITVGRLRYTFKELYCDESPDSCTDAGMDLVSCYSFSFHAKRYLAFFLRYFSENASAVENKPVLFDITDMRNPVYCKVPGYTLTTGPLCFGDFDKDKVLDYVAFSDNAPYYLRLYSLQRKTFLLNSKYYLRVNDLDGYVYTIDHKKSVWPGPRGYVYELNCK